MMQLHHRDQGLAARRPARSPSTGVARHAWRLTAVVATLAGAWVATNVFALGATPLPGVTAPVVDAAPQPEGLKGVPVPTPSNLGDFVANKSDAIKLGKALFWDMQLGSDGKTACASCHFQAGADSRSRNQVSPGLNRMASPNTANPDVTFQVGGPNYQFKADDFPFHKFADPSNRNSAVVRTHNDVASSQGVFNTRYLSAMPGASADVTSLAGDNVFQVGGLQTRKVEPRNTPTVINAIFNFRNFWDGRAQYLFNGATPFGALDSNARVYKSSSSLAALATKVSPVEVRIDNASLASLATGPALSNFEMSGAGRTWPEIGTRLLPARPLQGQKVSPTDSSLAGLRHASGLGLNGSYEALVKSAFKPEWWNGSQAVTIAGRQYTQAQANFSLFFGLAIQMYGSTLVSDDSPFDRYMAGNANALTPSQAAGLGLFFGKGHCANCHGGAEFTNASVRMVLKEPMSRMVMGNKGTAVYDEGFYNTAVAKTLEDIANGGQNDVGRPKSLTALAQQVGSTEFKRLIGIAPNVSVSATERIAVNGAFKTPSIRNVELTAPYFHNGDSLTLEQVVEFYNRGGNHFANNLADVDPDIQPLGLSATEKAQLVDFMKSTTDERVRYKRAPFDHPQLIVANGQVGSTTQVGAEGGKAADVLLEIPEVGAGGLSTPPKSFLDVVSMSMSPQVGSTLGTEFVDAVQPTGQLNGLLLRAGWWVDGLQGRTTLGDLAFHGNTLGGSAIGVSWPAGEYLVRTYGKAGSTGTIGQISFVTNTGRVLGPYGQGWGVGTLSAFDYTVPAGNRIYGFAGRSGVSLHALSVLYGQ